VNELGPTIVAAVLNQFLMAMTEVVFANQGIVDKFIGDAVMAVFGMPEKMEPHEQAKMAVACAVAMNQCLDALNMDWIKKGYPRFKMRIGINQGEAIIGHFGGNRRSDFTAIGTVVNLAARIESTAEAGEIFTSAEVKTIVDTVDWVSAGRHRLKGIAGEQELFKVVMPSRDRLVA
jgi:class 3 adenylate cyclase